jgi:hypothetical protein
MVLQDHMSPGGCSSETWSYPIDMIMMSIRILGCCIM